MAKASAKSAPNRAARRAEEGGEPPITRRLTIKQVVALVPFSARTVEEMLADGRLPYSRTTPNGPRYVRPEDVEALFVAESPRR
jgi:hypothetical protein